MEVYCTKVTSLQTNCYTVANGGEAFVIDPGAEPERIKAQADGKNLKIVAILLTHGHFDHVGGVAELARLTGARVYISETDYSLANSYKNLSFSLGGVMEKFTTADLLSDGDELTVCGLRISVIATPGHTAGGLCFRVENRLFSGDTLFELSYGRTDFPSGDFSALKNSLQNKLFSIGEDLVVCPGHGESTTLSFEKEHNPINFD